MAQQLFFSRDSKLYVEFDSKLWEVPVLDGFSFSQSTNTSDITLAEMQGADGISRRGRRLFTDSLAPAEWSFSTYVRPFFTSTEHHAVEEVLWAVMAGADKYGTIGTAGAISAVDFNAADSAGDRDPDAEGGSGMSASKMRAAAAGNDYSSFKTGLPSKFRDGEKLFNQDTNDITNDEYISSIKSKKKNNFISFLCLSI